MLLFLQMLFSIYAFGTTAGALKNKRTCAQVFL